MEYITALHAGTRLQEYEVGAVLGQGGFGITYLADDTNLIKRVALKEYLPRDFATRTSSSTVVPNSSADAPDYRWGLDRFLDEARTLARFDHPHLNKVHRFFEANGTAYLVLEYIDGQTLSHLLTKYPTLPNPHAQRIIREVLSGLAEVHQAGYVHRDIKPSNIMLRSDGSAVLLDFGAARQAVGQRSKSITSILTPGYAPVEQYDTKAEDVGPWSDLYALGMVAYRCVSGLRDAALPDAVTRSRAQRKGGVGLAPAVAVGKGVYDARFLEAIDWATQVNEEDRPQTIAAWREALSDGPDGEETERPGPDGEGSAGKKGPGRRSWVSRLALAGVGVTALGLGLWLLFPRSETGDTPVSTGPAEPVEESVQPVLVTPTPVVPPTPPPAVEQTTDRRHEGGLGADTNDQYAGSLPPIPQSLFARSVDHAGGGETGGGGRGRPSCWSPNGYDGGRYGGLGPSANDQYACCLPPLPAAASGRPVDHAGGGETGGAGVSGTVKEVLVMHEPTTRWDKLPASGRRVAGWVGSAVLLLLLVLPSPSHGQDAMETLFWESVECKSALQVQAYLETYPGGAYVVAAWGCLEGQLGLNRAARVLVQQGLASLGYAPGPADGQFGPATRRAVWGMAGSEGLCGDGVSDAGTGGHLGGAGA